MQLRTELEVAALCAEEVQCSMQPGLKWSEWIFLVRHSSVMLQCHSARMTSDYKKTCEFAATQYAYKKTLLGIPPKSINVI